MLISRTCLLTAFAAAPANPPGTVIHASAASTLTVAVTMTFFRNGLFMDPSLSGNRSFARAAGLQHGTGRACLYGCAGCPFPSANTWRTGRRPNGSDHEDGRDRYERELHPGYEPLRAGAGRSPICRGWRRGSP